MDKNKKKLFKYLHFLYIIRKYNGSVVGFNMFYIVYNNPVSFNIPPIRVIQDVDA